MTDPTVNGDGEVNDEAEDFGPIQVNTAGKGSQSGLYAPETEKSRFEGIFSYCNPCNKIAKFSPKSPKVDAYDHLSDGI